MTTIIRLTEARPREAKANIRMTSTQMCAVNGTKQYKRPAKGPTRQAKEAEHEKAEYIRQEMLTPKSDAEVKLLILEDTPVPDNVPRAPILDDYFGDALTSANMGHAKAKDVTLQRMQNNIRNILGPLTAVWTSLDQADTASTAADIEKIRPAMYIAMYISQVFTLFFTAL